MTKTFCDKCGVDCTYDNRGIMAKGAFYIRLKDKVAHSEVVLCLDCKTELEKVLEDFLNK